MVAAITKSPDAIYVNSHSNNTLCVIDSSIEKLQEKMIICQSGSFTPSHVQPVLTDLRIHLRHFFPGWERQYILTRKKTYNNEF